MSQVRSVYLQFGINRRRRCLITDPLFRCEHLRSQVRDLIEVCFTFIGDTRGKSQDRETRVLSVAFLMLLFNERRSGDRVGITDRRRQRRRRRRRVSRRTSTLLKTRKSIAIVENRRSDKQRLRTKFSGDGAERRSTRTRRAFVWRLEKHRRRGNFRRGDVTRVKCSTRRQTDRVRGSVENGGRILLGAETGRKKNLLEKSFDLLVDRSFI